MTRPASVRPRSRRASLLSAGAAGALTTALTTALIWAPAASAAPGAGTVRAGTASITISPTNSKETDVTQSSQRAFIDWTSFDLSSDEKVAFLQALGASSITFNRINSATATNISGAISAPGAVWLFTPSGLIIGPTASINVGSFVASTGNVNFGPTGPGAFLPLTDTSVSVTGAKALIDVQSGATINAASGFVVLNSEQVNQNGAITASDAVSFDLADASTIAFTDPDGASLQQLNSVTLNNAEAASATLNHGGTTTGSWIQVTGADETVAEPGLAGVINLTGVMTATAMAPSGTDQGSVMLVGVDSSVTTPIEVSNHSFTLNAATGAIGSPTTASTGGVYFAGSAASLGTVNAQGALYIDVDGALTLGGATTAGGAWLGAQSVAVNARTTLTGAADLEAGDGVSIADNASLSATGVVTLNAGGALTLGANAVLRSDSGGAGSRTISIQAASVAADASSVIAGGPASGAPTSDVGVTADQALTVGAVRGANVNLETDGGDIEILGPVTASVLFNAQAPTGSVLVQADIASQGAITINAANTISAAADVTLQSNLDGLPKAGISLTASDIDLDATSSLIAGPDVAHPVADIDVEGDNSASVGQMSGAFVHVLSAGDVTLGGDVTASNAVVVDDGSSDGGFSFANNVTVNAGVQIVSDGSIDIDAVHTIKVNQDALLQSGAGAEAGYTSLIADVLDMDATSSVLAGADLTHLAGSVTLEGDTTATIGKVAGGSVSVVNRGDVTLGGDVTATGDVTVSGNYFSDDSYAYPNNISVSDGVKVVAGGAVDLESYDTINVGSGALVQSNAGGLDDETGSLILSADDLEMQPTASVMAGPDLAHLAGDVTLEGDTTANIGKAAGGSITVVSFGDVTLAGDITSADYVSVWQYPNTVTVNAGVTVTAGGAIDIESGESISIGDGAVLQANTAGSGGNLYLESFMIDAAPTSLLAVGPLDGPGTQTVTVYADGGDLSVGNIVGTDVKLEARGQGGGDGDGCGDTCDGFGPVQLDAAGGSVYLEGSVKAAGDFNAISDFADVHADGAVTASGLVNLNAAGSIYGGPGMAIVGDTSGAGSDMTLTAGSGVIQLDAASSLQNGASLAKPTGAVTLTATDDISTGAIAGTDVKLTTPGAITVGGAIYGASSVTIDPTDVTLNANVSSGGALDITADNSITLGDGVTVSAADQLTLTASTIAAGKNDVLQSDSDGDGAGDLSLTTQSVTGGVSLIAGKDATHPSATVTADASAGGLALGGVTGGTVMLTAEGGDVSLAGPSTIASALTITATGGSVTLGGDVSAAGTVDVTADNDITLGAGVTIAAADHLNLTASTIAAGAGATLQSDSDGDGNGDLTLVMQSVTGGVTLIAGKDATHPSAAITADASAGGLDLGGVTGDVVSLTGEAGDVSLAGPSAIGAALTVKSVGGNVAIAGVNASGDIDLTADKAITVAAGAVVSAGGHVNATAASISVGAGGGFASDSDKDGAGDLTLHASTGDITAGAGASLDGGAAAVAVHSDQGAVTLGAASGGSLQIRAAKAVTLNDALTATGAVDVQGASIAANAGIAGGDIDLSTNGAVSVAANQTLQAQDALDVSATAITLGAKSVLQGDAAGSGLGRVYLQAAALTADPTSLLLAGPSTSSLTGGITVLVTGDVALGRMSGDSVYVEATGDVTVAGAVQAGAGGVSIDPGDLDIDADIGSGGAIDLATAGGALTIGSGVSITSTGDQVVLRSDGDLTISSGASITGVSLLAETQGVLHLAQTASLTTTGQATAPTWPIVPNSITTEGEGALVVSGLNIAAAGLDLQGTITAGSANARDDVYVTALGEPSAVVVGGADSTSGFHLSNAAVGHITARNLIVTAGEGEEGVNANIQVQDLTLDTAQLGALALGTDSAHAIDVTGAVSLTGGGATDLHLGFALATTYSTPSNNPDAPGGTTQTVLTGYVPGEIDISGSLGSAAAPFHAAVLIARDDIFMGPADFIAAAKADSAFDAGKSSDAYPIDRDHVFLASHDLEFAAQGRIIQQNTGGQLQYAGLVFDTPTDGHPLVASPTALDYDLSGGSNGGGWTPNYATGPTRVDVFGLVTRANGTSSSGVDAAQEPDLSAFADVSQYRINTCVFATRCLSAPPPRIEVPTDEIIQAQAAADASSASSTQTPTGFAQTIQIDDTSDDDKSANGAPVTGSGNGDLWTGPASTPH